MKTTTLRRTAVLAAVAACFTLLSATPSGAQAAPPPGGLGALLGALLDPLRGQPAPPPPPPAATVQTPVQTPVGPPPPPAASAAQATPPPPPASTGATPLAVEQRLAGLKYDVGPVDGNIDDLAASAVMAFQKVNGLERSGELDGPTGQAIMAASGDPAPLVPNSDANKVEIDLTRQVLFLYEGGSLSKILPVSSGTSETPTPTGNYRIYMRAQGWETSPLGRLYNSQYFVGGYAIHGSLSVPNYPASHGCVRLPMHSAEWFPDHVGIGTPVYVRGG
jgi:lipoprotein-anchoring transpeptidase ErfK/SrfK